METTSKKPASSSDDSATNSEPKELPERWSAPRKTELVLCVLRGESLDSVSRDSQVPAHCPVFLKWDKYEKFSESVYEGLTSTVFFFLSPFSLTPSVHETGWFCYSPHGHNPG